MDAVEHDPRRIMARSEFAPLRTVVVSQSQFGAPEALSESSTAFLAPEDREMLATMLGRDHADAFPERQRRHRRIRRLRGHPQLRWGVPVHHPGAAPGVSLRLS